MVFVTLFHAVASVLSGFCRRRREKPGTPLRTLCVAAFDFTARADRQQLGPEKRRALNCLLDLGALINDHFDQHGFCKRTYRRLRKQLAADETARAVYRDYFRRLRRVERNRPHLQLPCRASLAGVQELLPSPVSGEGPGVRADRRKTPRLYLDSRLREEVADYREAVVRLSLSALAAIALGPPNRANLDGTRPPAAKDACLPHLFALVMLLQICDDLLDWRNDWRTHLPSFVTAALLRCQEPAEGRGADLGSVRANIDTAATAYLAAMPRWNRALWPFALCTYAVFLLVKLLGGLALWGMRCRKQPIRPDLNSCRSILDVKPAERRKHAISLEG